MTDTNQRDEAVGHIILGVLITPVSIVAAFFALSLVWLSWGVFGIVLVGIAGAVAIFGPYELITGYQSYQEATNGCP